LTIPAPPERPPDPAPETLSGKVFAALQILPSHFDSDLVISGVRATDLFTFNASLGATIEEQVVDALNALRSATWDQDERYAQYRFVRQPQTFPDVVLKAAAAEVTPQILLGVELKGWYALAKEREPSFRYRVTPAACAPEDLLAVFPWALSRVISGAPELFRPYVAPARYAANYRNWHWEYIVRGGADTGRIKLSKISQQYPAKSQEIADEPESDRGGNFGRFARTGLMDDFMDELFSEELAGIPLDSWQKFLRLFGEQTPQERIEAELDRMAARAATRRSAPNAGTIESLRETLRDLLELLDQI
jgi:hypothetical protein